MWCRTPLRVSSKTNTNSLLPKEKNYYQNVTLSSWVSYIPLQHRSNF